MIKLTLIKYNKILKAHYVTPTTTTTTTTSLRAEINRIIFTEIHIKHKIDKLALINQIIAQIVLNIEKVKPFNYINTELKNYLEDNYKILLNMTNNNAYYEKVKLI